MMALAVAGVLLGSATTASAHVRPAGATQTSAASPVSAAPAVSVGPATAVAPAARPRASSGAASVQIASAATPSPAAGLGVAVLLTLLLAAIRAPRRVLIAALVLVLAIVAVEASVHSVHHLADQRAAAHCAVAAASAHVQGAPQPVAISAVWVPTPIGAVVAVESGQLGSRSLGPDEGRAPPSA
jgi:hypothetical protein